MDPAFRTLHILDFAPVVKLLGDFNGQAIALIHPADRITVAGTGAHVHLVRFQRDKARHRQAGTLPAVFSKRG